MQFTSKEIKLPVICKFALSIKFRNQIREFVSKAWFACLLLVPLVLLLKYYHGISNKWIILLWNNIFSTN